MAKKTESPKKTGKVRVHPPYTHDSRRLAEYVRKRMKSLGLNPSELKRATGVARPTIKRIAGEPSPSERAAIPTPETLIRLAPGLKVPPETLLRIAGWLPKEPEQTSDGRDLLHMFERLPPELQADVMDYIRFKFNQR